jgi:hypothetical protein
LLDVTTRRTTIEHVKVWSGDDVTQPFSDCQLGHRARIVVALGAVVDAWEDMTVEISHAWYRAVRLSTVESAASIEASIR